MSYVPNARVKQHEAIANGILHEPAVKVRHRNRYRVHVLKQGFHELRLSHRRPGKQVHYRRYCATVVKACR